MNFLNKLERKFGKFAIQNLMLYIMMGQTIVLFFTLLTNSTMLVEFLYFNPLLIIKGQIWRLFSFIFIPNTFSPIFFLFAAFLYYSIGSALERTWGEFKFNMYYLLGMLFNMIGLLIVQLIFYRPEFLASQFYLSTFSSITIYLNLSLFLAYEFITGDIASRVLIVVSLLNFFIFFGSQLLRSRPTATQRQFKAQNRELKQGPPIKVAFHKCTVCGKTELTDPDMEFRYCSKCNGNYEYCMDHLHNHEHIQ